MACIVVVNRTCHQNGNQFFCAHDSRCIAGTFVCDGEWHCSDGADERYNLCKLSSIFFAFNKKFIIIVNCMLLAVLSAFISPTLLYFILTSYLHRCFYVAGPGKAVSFFVRGIQYHTAQCCSIDGHIL